MRRLLALSLLLTACAGNAASRSATANTSSRVRAVPLATAFAQSGGLPSVSPAASAIPTSLPAPTDMVLAPDHILAPSIGLDATVISTDWTPGGEWQVPSGAAGWLSNSAYPGMPGNTVLAGHQNTEGEVFRRVSDLRAGDLITLHSGGQSADYRVQERLILPAWGTTPEQEQQYATYIARTRDARLTLVTCWPYFTNSHRVIVIALPAS